ncbi:hypothetical protein [Corynebacterium cystitidis]|uniref:hypothetical protein n=1 Tax=Corynebacterium cystitidis TaxID=35757 RepID=UPI00211EF2CA|nr:hypothetical protein [Corynebacterium cystitidis]
MMFSDNIQVPLGQLRSIAENLLTVHDELVAAESGAELLVGEDKVPGSGDAVAEALYRFYDEWKQSRKTLNDNVGVLSEVTTKIVDHISEFDGMVAHEVDSATDQLRSEVPRGGTACGQVSP